MRVTALGRFIAEPNAIINSGRKTLQSTSQICFSIPKEVTFIFWSNVVKRSRTSESPDLSLSLSSLLAKWTSKLSERIQCTIESDWIQNVSVDITSEIIISIELIISQNFPNGSHSYIVRNKYRTSSAHKFSSSPIAEEMSQSYTHVTCGLDWKLPFALWVCYWIRLYYLEVIPFNLR